MDAARTRILPAFAAAVVLALILLAGASGASASTTRTCSTPTYPSTGYFTSLEVTGTDCATGRKLALAYFKCRTKGGNLAGVCHGLVLGFTCHELRNSIPTEIDARVTCKRKGEVVVHTYQQNL